jgi:hypothetical protein
VARRRAAAVELLHREAVELSDPLASVPAAPARSGESRGFSISPLQSPPCFLCCCWSSRPDIRDDRRTIEAEWLSRPRARFGWEHAVRRPHPGCTRHRAGRPHRATRAAPAGRLEYRRHVGHPRDARADRGVCRGRHIPVDPVGTVKRPGRCFLVGTTGGLGGTDPDRHGTARGASGTRPRGLLGSGPP